MWFWCDDDEDVENGEVGDDSNIHDDDVNFNDNNMVGNYEKQELIKGDPRTQNVSFEDFFQHHAMVGGLGVECVALE